MSLWSGSMRGFVKETVALLAFIAVCALIALQVYGGYGNLPKYILGGMIVVGFFCLRWANTRGAQ
jgi:uncharacterized membrane protein required for colicin V production